MDGKGTVYTSGWGGKRFVMAAFPKKGKPTRRPIPCATSEGEVVGMAASLAAVSDGTLFWAQVSQHRVVRIGPDGKGGCYAGTGERGFSGDGGPALQAQLNGVTSLAYDPEEKALYLADSHNRRVRKVDAAGAISTVVGPEGLSSPGLGSGFEIAFDARRGRLYVQQGDPGIVYRTRDGQVQVIPNSRGDSFGSEGLSPDPTGGDLVTTRIRECDVVRISDDGKVSTVPAGRLQDCARQSTVDARGDIWLVTGDQLVVVRPGR